MIYVPADAPKAGFFSPLRLWLPYFSLSLSLSVLLGLSLSLAFPCSVLDTKSVTAFWGVLAPHG